MKESSSAGTDAGLFILRLVAGGSLFLKHGLEKILHFSQMAAHFPNPLGIGSHPTLIIALVSDAICSLLLVLGLATRWASAFIFANVFVAWYFVHHLQFFGHGSDHGELIVLYLGAALTLVFTGPGRFSLHGARRPRA